MTQSMKFNNYEQIFYNWLMNFVDKDNDGNALIFRDNPPSLEEVQSFGDKVYCVYTLFEGDFGSQTTQSINLFSYGSRQKVFAQKELLVKALLNNAVVINGENIKVKFTSGNPFVQDRTDSDENIKGYYINIISTVFRV